MNTRMLLTAVLRNRRSQWTLLPKTDVPGEEGAEGEIETSARALRPGREAAAAAPSRDAAVRAR